MILVFALPFLFWLTPAHSQTPTATPVPEASASPADDSNYEIDYEEEADAPADEEKPVKKQAKKSTSSGPAVQGTHSVNKFAPMIKSESKSVYKKNGKPLDVDSD